MRVQGVFAAHTAWVKYLGGNAWSAHGYGSYCPILLRSTEQYKSSTLSSCMMASLDAWSGNTRQPAHVCTIAFMHGEDLVVLLILGTCGLIWAELCVN